MSAHNSARDNAPFFVCVTCVVYLTGCQRQTVFVPQNCLASKGWIKKKKTVKALKPLREDVLLIDSEVNNVATV